MMPARVILPKLASEENWRMKWDLVICLTWLSASLCLGCAVCNKVVFSRIFSRKKQEMKEQKNRN